ncbi:serine aminopeptidase S33 family [Paractinoplanes brasiliensis]|uniref:Serine aminopeptidase S33 family n=1 Tax=Paractinoplanes brasiliensis TaxID=52695 RepID=A0A4R6J861_9ACTN|nr:serine aminopeptidase S33 family [Actinoplanes brasiliensis]
MNMRARIADVQRSRFRLMPPMLALVAVVAGGVMLARFPAAERVVVDGVPLDVMRPAGATPGPGVVVAHGFAGSARLMRQFGDTLVTRGYTVVLPDLDGHGASTRDPVDLQHDLDVAVTHLSGLPSVDPARTALVGHSMGAAAVTTYAATHPSIAATVAISLPGSNAVTPSRPSRLLMLVGQLEFPGFHQTVERALAGAGSDRQAATVPGVEHISILYAARTHRLTADWLDTTFGRTPSTPGLPSPLRRLASSGVLLLGLLLGFVPITRALLGRPSTVAGRVVSVPRNAAAGVDPPSDSTRRAAVGADPLAGPARTAAVAPGPSASPPRPGAVMAEPAAELGRAAAVVLELAPIAAVAAGGAVVAAVVAPFLPTARLELGGYAAGFTAVMGLAILAYLRRFPSPPGGLRSLLGALLLIPYAAATIAVPLHLGFTHAVPAGQRWWLLLLVWLGFAVLAYATGRLAGTFRADLLVAAITVCALTAASVAGLASGFLVLVVPLLAALMVIQAGLSAALRAVAAPPWLSALTGSVLVAWPIATTLPTAV